MVNKVLSSEFQSSNRDVRDLRFRAEMMLWRGVKHLRQHFRPVSDHTRVFISGAQRSGTNMLIECLDWSGQTDVYHESDPRAFRDYQMFPRDVIHSLVNSSRFPFFVIKALCEAEQIKAMLDEFSPAKAIWVVRDFRDTVNSAVRNFPDFTERVQEMADDPMSVTGWFARGLSDETLALLRRLNYPDMNSESASALRWYIRNVLFFEQGLEKDGRVLVIHYGDLVTDPSPTMEAVFRFIGLADYSSFITRKIHARSLRKNPEPPIHPDIYEACMQLQERFSSIGLHR